MADDHTLNWRVEQACFNAWPALRQIELDGWALRASGGPTRRANSANPLHPGAAASATLIEKVEAFYARQGRPALFRIPDMAAGIDEVLAARGYRRDAPTRTLFRALEPASVQAGSSVVAPAADEPWLAARDRIAAADAQAIAAYRAIIGAVTLPCGFACVQNGGEIASLAFGVLQDDLLVVESVMTDPSTRGRGLARQCLTGLFAWARGQGARSAALQVAADNEPALALYRSLEFTRDLYGYHYRTRD